MSGSFVKLNLGSILVPRETWDRAKKLGYSRDDIREIIVQNGEDSLTSSIDSQTFCKHGNAASGGICHQCEKEVL